MATYEIETESGAVYQIETEDPATFGGEVAGIANRGAEGAGALFDFAESASRNLNPFQMGGPRAFGLNENLYNMPPAVRGSEYIQDVPKLFGLTGEEKAQTPLGKIGEEVAFYAPGMLVPGGVVPSLGAGAAAGVTKASGGGDTAQLVASLFGSVAPSAAATLVGRGANFMRDLFSPAQKAEAAKDAAAEIISQVANKPAALNALDQFTIADSKVPYIQKQSQDYLPQYRRTAEITRDPGIAGIEETLRRTDPNFKAATALQDSLRDDARTFLYNRINPNPFSSSQAGTTIRKGLEAEKDIVSASIDEAAGAAFIGGEELPGAAAKRVVTGTLNSFTKDGSRKVTPAFNDLVERFRALPAKIDLKTLQNYRSAFGQYASPGPLATTEEKITATIANKMRNAVDASIETAIKKGELPKSQAAAWRNMVAARSERGALYESGAVGDVLERKPFNAGYEMPAEKIPSKVISTKEDAQQLISALKGQHESVAAVRSSLLSKVWDKSTNAMTGELNPTSFHRQLKMIEEVAPEILTSHQRKVLGRIGDDLTSASVTKRSAFRASKGNSITSESETAIDILQRAVGESTVSGARQLVQRIPLAGTFLDTLFNVVSNPAQRQAMINKELARFAMEPEYAKALLSRSPKEIEGILSEFIRKAQGALGAGGMMASKAIQDSVAQESPVASIFSAQPKNEDVAPMPEDNSIIGNSDIAPEVGAIVDRVIHQESRGKVDAVSPKGAQGLMQLMPATGREIADHFGEEYRPFDKEQNQRFGTYYLNKQFERFKDMKLALAAYNAGPNRVRQLLEKYGNDYSAIEAKLPKETRDYVKAILT